MTLFPLGLRNLRAGSAGRAYGSVDELLASGVDAVSVCTANTSHAAMAIQALRAGQACAV